MYNKDRIDNYRKKGDSYIVLKRTGGKFVVAVKKIAGRRKHIAFAFKNKAESEQVAGLADEFWLLIQTIYIAYKV